MDAILLILSTWNVKENLSSLLIFHWFATISQINSILDKSIIQIKLWDIWKIKIKHKFSFISQEKNSAN